MGKPIILSVDDDPEVLPAIKRDLQSKFGQNYRIVTAASGASALETLQQFAARSDVAALFLVDQRMPQMTGVEFLEQAKAIYPDAKRVLLTAYSDTEVAIRAINSVKIDLYLTKPYDPPEDRLFPVLNDLLDDWRITYRPPFEGIRVLGHRWSPGSHQVKDFLARNQVPYQWMDIETRESDPEVGRILDALGPDGNCLPVVLFPDGSRLLQPPLAELAEKVGLRTHAEMPFYDLIIIGGGPAGLAAAVYGASEGLNTLMVEREAPGGQAGTSSRIENYLGFPSGLSGAELARRAVTQAKRFGVEILAQEATKMRVQDQYRIVTLGDGSEVNCHALLVSTGVSYRKLDIPGADALTGAGVYYGAAMTEALECRGDEVYLIGGANSAGQAAIYFSKFARKVTMLVRADSLTKSMSQYLIEEIEQTPNITVLTNTWVASVHGTERLEEITLETTQSGQQETVPAKTLFIFIGAIPRTDWLDGQVLRDTRGFILAGPDLKKDGKMPNVWTQDRDPFLLETSIPGVFVAGDVRANSVKRVASGVGEGSIAVQFIHQYLARLAS